MGPIIWMMVCHSVPLSLFSVLFVCCTGSVTEPIDAMVLNTERPLTTGNDEAGPGGTREEGLVSMEAEEESTRRRDLFTETTEGQRSASSSRPMSALENRVSQSGRVLPALRRISTTPLGRHHHHLFNDGKDPSTTSSIETLSSATIQPSSSGRRKGSLSDIRKHPLRSAVATARRIVGGKSNEIQPGISSSYSPCVRLFVKHALIIHPEVNTGILFAWCIPFRHFLFSALSPTERPTCWPCICIYIKFRTLLAFFPPFMNVMYWTCWVI